MNEHPRVRLDRWLWAARFFKTRAAAKKALESGQISCAGQRPKPSRDVSAGMELTITRGDTQYTVVITGVAEKRGSATAAAQLYQETPESVVRRQQFADKMRLHRAGASSPPSRPDRRDRRALKQLKQFTPEHTP